MPDNEHGTLWHFSREEQPLRPASNRPSRSQSPLVSTPALAQSPPQSQSPLQAQPRPRRPARPHTSGTSTPLRTLGAPTPARTPGAVLEPAERERERERKIVRPHARRVSSSRDTSNSSPALSAEGFEQSQMAPQSVPVPTSRTPVSASARSPSSLARHTAPASVSSSPDPPPRVDKKVKPRPRTSRESREAREVQDISSEAFARLSLQADRPPAGLLSSLDAPPRIEEAMARAPEAVRETTREFTRETYQKEPKPLKQRPKEPKLEAREAQETKDAAAAVAARPLLQDARYSSAKLQLRRSEEEAAPPFNVTPNDLKVHREPFLALPESELSMKKGKTKAKARTPEPDPCSGSDMERPRAPADERRKDHPSAAEMTPSTSRTRREKARSHQRTESRPRAKGKDGPHSHERAWEQSYLAAHGDEIAALNKARSQPARPSAAEQGVRRPKPLPEPIEIPQLPPVPKAPPSSITPHGKSPPPEPPEMVVALARPMPIPRAEAEGTHGSPLAVAPGSSSPGPQIPARIDLRNTQSQSAKPRPHPRPGLRSSISSQARPLPPGAPGQGVIGSISPPSMPEMGMQRVESAPSHTSAGLSSLRIPPPVPHGGPIQAQMSPLHGPDRTSSSIHLVHPQRSHGTRAPLHHQPYFSPWTVGSAPTPVHAQHMGALGGALAIEKPRKNRLVPIPSRWNPRSLSQHYAPAVPAELPSASMPLTTNPSQGAIPLSPPPHMFSSPSAPLGDVKETRERGLREPHPSYLAPHGHPSSSLSNSPASELSPASGSVSASSSGTPNTAHATLPRQPVQADALTPIASQGGGYFPPTAELGIPDAPEGSSDEYEDEEEARQEEEAGGEGEDPLYGPAGSAAASRRPPEYDTGVGKDSKTAWPWRHLTRDAMDTIKDRAEDQDPASSLVVHARFTVFAVSGSTILTAHNHKVKIFRAGTVRAEVAGITDAAIVPPNHQQEKSGSHGAGTEKIATVADTPGGPNRVTALCFLAPEGEELGRYAWVGTASGTVWELDVVKETRVAVNRLVHKQPILHIARLGRRMCIVDEGGKISTWTPARGKSPLPEDRTSLSVPRSAAESSLSLTIPSDPVLRPSMDGSTLSLNEGDTSEGSTPGLLGTKAITQRVSVEGKCVPLLVGDQLWVATGGVSSSSYSSSQADSTPGPHKKHGHLHRSIRRSVRVAAGVAATATGTAVEPGSGEEFHKSVRVQIYNPFADDRPFVATMVPPTLPPTFSSTPVGAVTDAAIVPASRTETVFLSHTSGHISEWSRKTHQCVGVHHQSSQPILAMTAAGRYLWAGTKGGSMLVFGLGDGTRKGKGGSARLVLIKAWPAHSGAVTALVTDPDSVAYGRLQVVSGGLDGAVRIWDGLLTHDWFERRLQRSEADLTTRRTIRSLQVTYNIDAADPEDLEAGGNDTFLLELLRSAGRAPSVTVGDDASKPIGPEIIVFGLQELIDLEDKRLTAKNLLLSKKKIGNELGERISTQYAAWRTRLIHAVDETYGVGAYELVESELLVGLMTCLFVSSREVQAGTIRDAAVGTVKTGFFGGRYGNKGAVAARLVVDDSSLCFVNCHLAAGQHHVQARNNDAATILSTPKLFPRAVVAGAEDGPIPPRLRRSMAFTRGGDGEQILDHEAIFWSGDLNYRVNLSRGETLRYLQSGNITALLDGDQLRGQSGASGFALRAFSEAPITFPPTYKFNRGSSTYDSSAKQRTPAWCDRVLWCDAALTYPSNVVRGQDAQDDALSESVLGPPEAPPRRGKERARVTSVAYRSWAPTISDHRPVSAAFEVSVKRLDAQRLARIVPRLRDEWAVVQAALLDEARAYFQTTIVG